jgi:hypothetical protein
MCTSREAQNTTQSDISSPAYTTIITFLTSITKLINYFINTVDQIRPLRFCTLDHDHRDCSHISASLLGVPEKQARAIEIMALVGLLETHLDDFLVENIWIGSSEETAILEELNYYFVWLPVDEDEGEEEQSVAERFQGYMENVEAAREYVVSVRVLFGGLCGS